jgi:hypothetical protein
MSSCSSLFNSDAERGRCLRRRHAHAIVQQQHGAGARRQPVQQRDEGQPDVLPRSGPDGGTPPGHGSTHGPIPGSTSSRLGPNRVCRRRRVRRASRQTRVAMLPPRRPVAQAGEFAPAAQQGLLDAVLGILHAAHHAIAMALQLEVIIDGYG